MMKKLSKVLINKKELGSSNSPNLKLKGKKLSEDQLSFLHDSLPYLNSVYNINKKSSLKPRSELPNNSH